MRVSLSRQGLATRPLRSSRTGLCLRLLSLLLLLCLSLLARDSGGITVYPRFALLSICPTAVCRRWCFCCVSLSRMQLRRFLLALHLEQRPGNIAAILNRGRLRDSSSATLQFSLFDLLLLDSIDTRRIIVPAGCEYRISHSEQAAASCCADRPSRHECQRQCAQSGQMRCHSRQQLA